MGKGFWPTLPLHIPYSPGMSHWWDPVWWIFQIVVMSAVLLTLRKVAIDVDSFKASASKTMKSGSADKPPNFPG